MAADQAEIGRRKLTPMALMAEYKGTIVAIVNCKPCAPLALSRMRHPHARAVHALRGCSASLGLAGQVGYYFVKDVSEPCSAEDPLKTHSAGTSGRRGGCGCS